MSANPNKPDETSIIDPERPIIDSQFHLFDRPTMRYMLEDYLADIGAGHKIVASVYVETQAFVRDYGPELLRPLGEIEFANEIATKSANGAYGATGVAAAIVGHADLRHGQAIAELLDQALELAPGRTRGIRQITLFHESPAPYRFMSMRPPRVAMDGAEFRDGFGLLARRGLSFDAAIFHTQLPELTALASAFPDTTIILNHLGYAMALDEDAAGRASVFESWRRDLIDLARRPNVFCKVGGLGMPPWGFGFESRAVPATYKELAAAWKPYIETAISTFGAYRCMMESNFPPDKRSCNYVALWNALKYIVRDYSESEKTALFSGTAARVYRMADLE